MELNSSLIEQIIKDYRDRIQEIKEEIKMHISDKKDLETKLKIKKQKNKQLLEQKNNQISQLTKQNDELAKQNKDLQEKVDGLQKGMKESLKQKKEQIDKLNADNKDLERTISRLQQQIDGSQEKTEQQNSNNNNPVNNSFDISTIQELKQCENMIQIWDYGSLDDDRMEIKKYQDEDEEYQIQISFGEYFDSLDAKMEAIKMINLLGADSKVGIVHIEIDSSNEWDNEIIRMMMNRYTNLHGIGVTDISGSVDQMVHGLIKEWVVQQPVISFALSFCYGSLASDANGLKLIKEYNQLLKQNQYLEKLYYQNDIIYNNENIEAKSKQEVQKLIKQVDKLKL